MLFLILAGTAQATISKTIEVPKERFLKYDISLDGNDLKMEIVPDGQKAEEIESSSVQAEDDTVAWTADAGNATNKDKHIYTSASVVPGQDWVHIRGTFKPLGGGDGPGEVPPPAFDVTVHKVVVLEEGTTQPDPQGLVVVKGGKIVFKIYPEETAELKYPAGVPTWHTKQMKGDGDWTSWAQVTGASGPSYTYTAATSGIFRLKAVFPGGIEVEFLRENDEKKDGVAYSSRKKGEPDAFGVVDKQIYNAIRLKAREALLSTAWAYLADNPPFAPETNKCNQFVANMIEHEDVGGTVPRIYYPSAPQIPELPLANQWAGTTDTDPNTSGHQVSLEGWSDPITESPKPQPGWVVAYPRHSGSGHVGILDYDGTGIGAGDLNVDKSFDFYRPESSDSAKNGATRHRKN